MYELYDAHVKALAAKLPAMQLPAYCKNLNARANPQGAPGGHASHVHVGRIPMPRSVVRLRCPQLHYPGAEALQRVC